MSLKRRLIGYLILIALTVIIIPLLRFSELLMQVLLPIIYGVFSYKLTKHVWLPNLLMLVALFLVISNMSIGEITKKNLFLCLFFYLLACCISLTLFLCEISKEGSSLKKNLIIYFVLPYPILINTIGLFFLSTVSTYDLGVAFGILMIYASATLTILIIYGVQTYESTGRVILPNLVLFVYISVWWAIYKFLYLSPKQSDEYLEVMFEILILPIILAGISLISSFITMICTKIYNKLKAKKLKKLSQE